MSDATHDDAQRDADRERGLAMFWDELERTTPIGAPASRIEDDDGSWWVTTADAEFQCDDEDMARWLAVCINHPKAAFRLITEHRQLARERDSLREAIQEFVDAESDDAANDRRNEGTRYRWANAYKGLRAALAATGTQRGE